MSAPKVWSKFSGSNGSKLVISTAPADRIAEALDLHVNQYLANDAVAQALGIIKNKEAIEEYKKMMDQDSNTIIALVCGVDNGSGIGDIVGVFFSYLVSSEQPFEVPEPPKNKELQRFMAVSQDMHVADFMSVQKVEKYFDSFGLGIHPNYKDLGIEKEFLKASKLLAKDQGIPVTVGWMIDTALQNSAQQEGYETFREMNYKEFGQKHGLTFENAPTTIKFMVAKV